MNCVPVLNQLGEFFQDLGELLLNIHVDKFSHHQIHISQGVAHQVAGAGLVKGGDKKGVMLLHRWEENLLPGFFFVTFVVAGINSKIGKNFSCEILPLVG